jgi:hypothetical protein
MPTTLRAACPAGSPIICRRWRRRERAAKGRTGLADAKLKQDAADASGTTVRSDSGEVDRVLSAYFKHNVTLGRAAPDDFTIDQYHPDVEGADPGGNRDTVVASKLGAALFSELGMKSPVPVGSFFDAFPGPDDVDARAARRASAPEPLRPAQVPHERDRQDRASRIRRERLGGSQAQAW